MNQEKLWKTVSDIQIIWKNHFGLGTYYVGYLSEEEFIVLFKCWSDLTKEQISELSDFDITTDSYSKVLSYFEMNGQLDGVNLMERKGMCDAFSDIFRILVRDNELLRDNETVFAFIEYAQGHKNRSNRK